MPKPKRPIAVYGAIAANLFIAAAKFGVGAITGSSAMLSEGIHSTADTGDELLLLLGIRRSHVPPDELHPFGHGKELYFWSLIVAIVLFALGGGMSIYEGITHLQHPNPIENPIWNYAVLAISFVAEFTSWNIAMREFLRQEWGGETFWENLRTSKDPATYTIIAEDSAAIIGLLFAFLGILLENLFQNPFFDGAASIAIGLLLTVVATFLAWQSRGLLVGESANRHVVRGIFQIAAGDEAVQAARPPLTMQLAPDQLLVNLDLEFRKGLSARDVVAAVGRIEKEIRRQYPTVQQIFIEAGMLEKGAEGDGSPPP